MNAKVSIAVFTMIILLCLPIASSGNDLINFEQGARAAAMANAFIARAYDPSAIWYNPAGITQLEGLQVYGGGLSLKPGDRSYYSIYRDKTLISQSDLTFNPMLYLSYRLSERIGFGLGINSPNRYSLHWPKTSEVEHLVYIMKKLQINTTTISPVVAVQLTDKFSIGAGLNINTTEFALQYHYPFDINVMVALLTNGGVMDVPEILFDLSDFKTTTFSFFAGLKWMLDENISLAAVYRRGYPLSFNSGQVKAVEPRIADSYVNSKLAALFPDSPEQSADISFKLVDQLTTGIALKIGKSLELELDLGIVFWSQMEKFTVDYSLETNFAAAWTGYYDLEATLDFKDVITVQLGVEYSLNDFIDLRCGAFYYGPPLESRDINPAFPFTTNSGFTLGLGYHRGNYAIDIAYVNNSSVDIEGENGTYSRWGDDSQKYLARVNHSFLFSLGFRF